MDRRVLELWRCELPIQLAPMGSVSATPRLALAVSAAGAHAMYPALALPPAALAPAVEALAQARAAFGVNFLVPMMDPGSLELALERAPYVDFFLDDADPALVGRVHGAGAICGWQVETAEEARAAEAAGCDLVIAKAWESGGRKRVEGPTLLALLDAVLDAVAIPVVAAGGIATARGVAAALAAGASGVRVGTRFIAAAESDAHPDWIAAVLDAPPPTPSSATPTTPAWSRPVRTGCCAARSPLPRRSRTTRWRRSASRAPRSPSPASARSRRPATPPVRSPLWRSTPASRPARSTRSLPPPTSSPSSQPGSLSAGVRPLGATK